MDFLSCAPSAAGAGRADLFDLLLLRVGGQTFGLPLRKVLHIVPLPADFIAESVVPERFVFRQMPLSFVSLWGCFGKVSEHAEFGEILTMLPQRRQDHIDWLTALEASICSGVPFVKARNPRECAFGKWYYGYRPRNQGLSLLLAQFEAPHAAIHGLANDLLALSEAGRRADALRALEEARHTSLAVMLRLFDLVQERVTCLKRRVAVIIGEGEPFCALGADGVRDIVQVPRYQVVRGSGAVASARSQDAGVSGLVVLDDQTVVPLLDCHALCPGG